MNDALADDCFIRIALAFYTLISMKLILLDTTDLHSS
jgi:hypothetical protein